MKLEDAHHLKEVACEILNQKLIVPYSSSETVNWQCQLALGVHPTSDRNYKLAIHVSDRDYLNLPEIEQITNQACGEVDIQVTGAVQPYDKHESHFCPQKRVRPLSMGVSISHYSELAGAGTLGCFVRKKQNPSDLFLLSSNHILACKNSAEIRDSIIQPAQQDGGVLSKDNIAALTEFIPLKNEASNFVDAAIAKIDKTEVIDPIGLYLPKNQLNINAFQGIYQSHDLEEIEDLLRVMKMGRTTGLTSGKITAFDLDRVIPYGRNMICNFQELIAIEGLDDKAFSHKGDSGSLIFDKKGYGIALLLGGTKSGGSNNQGITYANPIHHVFNALDIELAI